jgi:hypothetical protein
MTEAGGPPDTYLELSFAPSLRLVPIVRRFVGEFYVTALTDPEVTSKMTVAAHELLENAVTYSADGHTMIRVTVSSDAESVQVSIDTLNRTSAAHVAKLSAQVDELRAAPDPNAYYLELLRRTAKKTTGSGLGLGRVCAESDMRVSCDVEGELVHVRALAQFPTAVLAEAARE